MLIRLLFVLRRRWPIVVLLPLLAAGAGYVFTPRGDAVVPTNYTAAAVIAVDQTATPIEIQQALLEVQQGETARVVARDLGSGATASDVGRRVSAEFNEETFVVTLTVSGDTKAEAQRYADAVSVAFVETGNGGASDDQQQQVDEATERRDKARTALTTFYDENQDALSDPNPPPRLVSEQQILQNDLNEADASLSQMQQSLQTTEIYRLVNVTSASRSVVDKLQIPASTMLRVTLGLIFGLIGAAALVAAVEKLNPRIDEPSQAAALVGAPVLAMVPVMSRRRRGTLNRADPHDFRGPFAESFRSMRTHLDFRVTADGRDRPPRIMVTSATPAEGKSTSVAFLALAFAEAGRPPIVVGADLRRPAVHKLFGVARIPGLSSRAVSGGASVPLSDIVTTDPTTGVSVVPSGPAVDRVTGLLGDLTAVTRAGQSTGRVVLVDTAPVMVANDATDFLIAVDWVVVVVRVGRSTERAVRQMMQTLRLNDATVVGVVMVGSLESSDAKRYYYSYYDTEADTDTDDQLPRSRPAPVPPSDGTPLPVTGTIDAPA